MAFREGQRHHLWDGSLVSDEQVKEWISELVEGDGRAYGYLKLHGGWPGTARPLTSWTVTL